MPDGKTIVETLERTLYDREAALEQGVGCAKAGSRAAVRRAGILMYQAVHTLSMTHEVDIRKYWMTSNDAYPAVY